MQELEDIDKATHPANIFLVLDAMTGQDAVRTAEAFNERLNLDGVILTKLDGDARGGAALSVKEVTGKPIKFLGMGETLDRLEEFRPEGIASRILGMGDIVGLVKDFEQVVDAEKAEEDAVRMLKGKFDMQDFLEQIRLIQKMGSLKDLFDKLPFFPGGLPEEVNLDDRELTKIEAMISSMTAEERREPDRLRRHLVGGGRLAAQPARRASAGAPTTTRTASSASRSGSRPQRGRGQGAAAEVRRDAPDDGAARRVDRPARQDPRLQAVQPDEEAGRPRPRRHHGRRRRRRHARRWPAPAPAAAWAPCPACRCRSPACRPATRMPGTRAAVRRRHAPSAQRPNKKKNKRKAEKAARKKSRKQR